TSIGAWIFLAALARIWTGATTSRFDSDKTPSGSLEVGPLTLPWTQLFSIAALLVVGGALFWILQGTRLGAAMRAVGSEAKSAAISGVNPLVIVSITGFLAGAFAGVAGFALGLVTDTIN